MTFELRHQTWGLAVNLIGFVAYWAVIVVRALGDDLPLTEVAWQHPLLWLLGLGAAVYGGIYGAAWWSTRGTIRTDERDAEIARYADAAGSGMTALGAVAAMVMLALDVHVFWAVHTLFVMSFLGAVASSGLSLAAYKEGLES